MELANQLVSTETCAIIGRRSPRTSYSLERRKVGLDVKYSQDDTGNEKESKTQSSFWQPPIFVHCSDCWYQELLHNKFALTRSVCVASRIRSESRA